MSITLVEPSETIADEKLRRREVLLDAAALIEEYGWTKGANGMPDSGSHRGYLCMLGAVAMAASADRLPWEDSYEVATRFIFETRYTNCARLAPLAYEWNDNQRSQEPVVTALRCLADGASWSEVVT